MTHRSWDRAQSRTSYRRAYDASQQALEVALRENRVRGECLALAVTALGQMGGLGSRAFAQDILAEIEQRLAQLVGSEEEMG